MRRRLIRQALEHLLQNMTGAHATFPSPLAVSEHPLWTVLPLRDHIELMISAQTLTIDITLCGAWAGVASLLEETCPPLVGTNTW